MDISGPSGPEEKYMTKNKAIAALMAALMALSVFTGCQPKPQPAPPVEDTVMSSIEKTAAGQYLVALLSDKLISDIDRDLRGGTTAGFDVTGAVWDETANTITVSVSMKSHDLDGIDGSLAATGETDIVFEGEVNDIYFEADAYTVNAEETVFEGGKTALSLSLSNIKGAFVGETGNETLSFIARDHKVESIIQGDQGVVHFGEPASGRVKADGRIAVTVKDVIDAYNETLTPDEPETLPAETTADVNAIFGGAYDAFTVWETSTKDFTAGGYTGKAELTVNADKSWSMHVMADKDSKAAEPTATVYDIEFTVTSEDVEKGNAIAVKVEGKGYTAPVADVIEGVIEEEVPFEWDITARLAKHSRGAAEDHDNWEHIQSLEYKNGTISIVADVDAMEVYTSSNPSQGDGKWLAVLVGTGEDDITKVTYKTVQLTEQDITDRNDMLGADGSKAESDEFVIWYKAEELAEKGAEFTLSHDGVEDETVKVELEAVYHAPDAEVVKADLTQFFGEFAKVQGWDHGMHEDPLYVDTDDLYGFSGWDKAVTGYISFGKYADNVEAVSMVGEHFTADTEMQVSIGHNVFYRDKGWYVDENGNLMINKLFMYATLAFGESFVIDGTPYDEYTLDLEDAEKLSLTFDWKDAANSSITPLGGDEYNVVVGVTNKPLYSEYTGQSDDDIILGITDYGMRNGTITRQLALMTGEKDQFISYFYGWDTTMETIYNAYDRDVVDKSIMFKADGSVKGRYEATYHVTSAYIVKSQLQDVIGYFEYPAHERILNRIGGVTGSAGGPITIGTHTYNAAEGTLAINVTLGDGAEGFEYQKEGLGGVKESHKAIGDVVFTFTGTAEGDVFKADSWMISTEGLDIDGEHEFITEGFGGKIATGGALDDTPGTADFGLSAGDWDGSVKNPKEAKFSVALGLEGSATVNGKILESAMFADMI